MLERHIRTERVPPLRELVCLSLAQEAIHYVRIALNVLVERLDGRLCKQKVHQARDGPNARAGLSSALH